MKIYLVRHGQTLFNQQKKVQGWCDSPLTQEGIQQAIAVSKTLQSISFECAYSSTSERAMDTMHYILQDRSVPYAYVKGLKELNFGSLEGEKKRMSLRILVCMKRALRCMVEKPCLHVINGL